MPNNIPSIKAAGKFVVSAPFDKSVNPATFYVVEAIRTIPEMQALKLDLFKIVYEPLGYKQDNPTDVAYVNGEIEKGIADGAVVVTLTSRGKPPAYALSTYIVSFPIADGVIYERLGLVVDLGPCPPSMKEVVNNALAHMENYVKATLGIKNPNAQLGTVPVRGYVSKETAKAWDVSRKLAITEEPSDTIIIEQLKKENAEQFAYIKELEAALKAKS